MAKAKARKYITNTDIIRFEVDQQHIADGKRNDALSCPVALALDSVLGDRYAVIGFYHMFLHSKVYGERPTICIKTPDAIREYIHGFDNTGQAEPATFELKIET